MLRVDRGSPVTSGGQAIGGPAVAALLRPDNRRRCVSPPLTAAREVCSPTDRLRRGTGPVATLIMLSDYAERRASPPTGEDAPRRAARILFFTGVRYERIDDPAHRVAPRRIEA